MKEPEITPEEVTSAFASWLKKKQVKDPPRLNWDGLNRCYFFWHGNVYHGVELDGHIHT
jgi:hypothetical protein